MNILPFKNEPLTDFSKLENRQKMLAALERVEKQLGREYPIMVGDEEIYTEGKIKSYNPSKKDEVIGVFQKATPDIVDKAIEQAWSAFQSWSRLHFEERSALLFRAAKLMRERKFELSAWMVLEVGKNWIEADADVAEMIDYFEFYGREMLRYGQPQELTPYPGEVNEYTYIPLGVGAVIPPWNFPLAILGGMTTAGVVTGNTIILKPASDSPAIGYQFYKLMRDAGLPPNVIQFVTGSGGEMGDYLVSHPKIRFIAFTGSMEVGTRIYELASRVQKGQIWLKRVIAEMGGKDAIIVDRDFDHIDFAVQQVGVSAFGFQGQKCSACSRLILHKDIYDEFLHKLRDWTERVEVGPARDNYFMGPVINARAEEKILSYIEIGKQEGRLVTGGEKAGDEGYFIRPTIFADVDRKARIAQEEIFGPVLAVIRAESFDEALEIANDSIYGLTGAVFSRNRWHIRKAKEEFHCGNLYINRKCTGALVDVQPFGGFNMSGTDSKAGGRDYLLLFLQGKSISERL